MKSLLPTLLAVSCVLAFAAPSGWAQAGTKRTETPSRTPVPRNPAPDQSQPAVVSQPLPLASPQLPAPAVTSQGQPRPFNLDTALARLLADLKAVTATGEFELVTTNADKVEVTTLPLVLHLMEGRVRTELDIRSVPPRVDATGPFTMLRGAGITRIVTLSMASVGVRLTHQLFPEARAYITQELPDEDIPALIKLEKRSLGPDPANQLEQVLATLTFTNGEKREARLWQTVSPVPQPAQIQFNVGHSRITIRIRALYSLPDSRSPEGAQQNATLFQIPPDYTKHSDVGYLLQTFSARRIRALR